MSETTPLHPPYLRRVTFLDTEPDDVTGPPVHVTQKLLLDGEEHGEVIAREGWHVFADEFGGATIVSFVAFAEHVTLKTYPAKGPQDSNERLSGTHIAGIPVCTPGDHEWERLAVVDGAPELVRVFFFAREVEVVAARKPAGVPA